MQAAAHSALPQLPSWLSMNGAIQQPLMAGKPRHHNLLFLIQACQHLIQLHLTGTCVLNSTPISWAGLSGPAALYCLDTLSPTGHDQGCSACSQAGTHHQRAWLRTHDQDCNKMLTSRDKPPRDSAAHSDWRWSVQGAAASYGMIKAAWHAHKQALTAKGLGCPLKLALVSASGRCRRRHTLLMKSLSGMRTPALLQLSEFSRRLAYGDAAIDDKNARNVILVLVSASGRRKRRHTLLIKSLSGMHTPAVLALSA